MRRISRTLTVFVFLGALSAAWGQLRVAVTRFVHPGMNHSRAELDFVRQQVQAGTQPRKDWFDRMAADARSKLSWTAKPVANVVRGAYNNPNIGADAMGHDANAAYAHAFHLAGRE